MKEGNCSDAWKSFACHCVNVSSIIQGIDFYQSYSPVTHFDYFTINVAIADMHRPTVRCLCVIDTFYNTNSPIHEIFDVSPPPYYMDWFEKYFPIVPLNRHDSPFSLMHEWNKGNKTIQTTI